jgi:membrane protease YdiL (CAAX protease family)
MSAISLPRWKLSATTSLVICVVLALVFAAMRAVGVLGPVHLKFFLPLGFMLMALVPWVLLTRVGRIDIGFQKPVVKSLYFQAAFFGAVASLLCFVVGLVLFGASLDNWYVSVALNFSQSVKGNFTVWQLYLMFTIPSLIFSPIGEEIFFRGVFQDALEVRFSERLSTLIESVVFGLVHLCHHGLLISIAGVTLLWRSAPIWFVLMVLVAFLFAWLRKRSGSLYPAIISHMVFNFVMSAVIFVALWPVNS